MNQNKKKIDWSGGYWKDMLIDQRKFIWHKDTVDKLARWLGLVPGMTAVDVGCGLGNLGYIYWPYFGKNGRYFGVDESMELIQQAEKSAKDWATGGEARFITGDAYKLPFPDDFADWVMCQTLLIHLKDPERALAEMIRVAKPGGLILCNEPDNLSTMLAKHYWSLPELEVEEELLLRKIYLICNKGAINLGRGDNSIANKVPVMMKKFGLTDIEARLNDKAQFLYPPYEGSRQQNILQMIKKRVLDQSDFWMERVKEEFLAGGGDLEEYRRFREISDRLKLIFKNQFEAGEYIVFTSGFFYAIKGRKPE
ncbi:MAG: methyltransferase domain-containing protein [candidate division Zixibacteria bacterium]|nr:methyltransferase domain-containing protein [candidate division Zixibacteria bacterium]